MSIQTYIHIYIHTYICIHVFQACICCGDSRFVGHIDSTSSDLLKGNRELCCMHVCMYVVNTLNIFLPYVRACTDNMYVLMMM